MESRHRLPLFRYRKAKMKSEHRRRLRSASVSHARHALAGKNAYPITQPKLFIDLLSHFILLPRVAAKLDSITLGDLVAIQMMILPASMGNLDATHQRRELSGNAPIQLIDNAIQ